MKQTVAEKIKQRRLQMLVHSYLYYEKDVNIISDAKWSEWAKELAQLQKDHPQESQEVEYAEIFEGWDGNSGAYLLFDNKIIATAEQLYKNYQKPVRPKVVPKKKRRHNGLFG